MVLTFINLIMNHLKLKNISRYFGFVLLAVMAVCFTSTDLQAQKKSNDPVFTKVQHQAKFPGGLTGFVEYLSRNLHYPARAVAAHTHGNVFVRFVVEKDGSLSDIKILRGIGHGCDEEAVRVLKASPKWQPGKQNKKSVRTQFTLPINFTLA